MKNRTENPRAKYLRRQVELFTSARFIGKVSLGMIFSHEMRELPDGRVQLVKRARKLDKFDFDKYGVAVCVEV